MGTLTDVQRDELVYNASFLVENTALLGYSQFRPLRFYTKAKLEAMFSAKRSVTGDCAWSVMQLYYMSECKDPSGYSFDGDGNTVTMLAHLKHYERAADAHAGALVVFGANLPLANQHVCMVWEKGADPLVFSHGQPGAEILKLSEEATAHPGAMVTFLDVSSLG